MPATRINELDELVRSTSRSKPSIALVILLLATLLKRSANMAYNAELGLSSVAWTIIARLGADGPMTQTELAERYLIDKGQLSRTAVELTAKGLLLREKRDWRTIELRISAKGRKVFSMITRIRNSRHRALVAGITESELRTLYKALDKLKSNAGALLNQLSTEQSGE